MVAGRARSYVGDSSGMVRPACGDLVRFAFVCRSRLVLRPAAVAVWRVAGRARSYGKLRVSRGEAAPAAVAAAVAGQARSYGMVLAGKKKGGTRWGSALLGVVAQATPSITNQSN